MMEPETYKRYMREAQALVKAASDDPRAFAQATDVVRMTQHWLHDAVANLRNAGYSDQQIGHELGITRQAVRSRYPRRRP